MILKDLLARLTVGRALVFGAALAAVYYFLVYDNGVSLQQNIAASKVRLEQLKNEVQENQRKLDRAMVYKKTAAEVGNTINKLLSIIPEKFGMPDLMRLVANEAKVAGSSQVNLRPVGTVTSAMAKEFEEVSVDVELNGSFLQHMIFLSNLTKIPQILIVKKFDFSVGREGVGDEPPMVKMVAQIVAYRYRGSVDVKGATEGTGK